MLVIGSPSGHEIVMKARRLWDSSQPFLFLWHVFTSSIRFPRFFWWCSWRRKGYNAGGFVLTESAGAVNIEVENLFKARKLKSWGFPGRFQAYIIKSDSLSPSQCFDASFLDGLKVLRSDSRSQGIAACQPQKTSNQSWWTVCSIADVCDLWKTGWNRPATSSGMLNPQLEFLWREVQSHLFGLWRCWKVQVLDPLAAWRHGVCSTPMKWRWLWMGIFIVAYFLEGWLIDETERWASESVREKD